MSLSEWEFLDWKTSAERRGITVQTLKARVLDGKAWAFVYLSNQIALGTQENFLPPWSDEESPFLQWEDYGSATDIPPDPKGFFDEFELRYILGKRTKLSRPIYRLKGWVLLGSGTIAQILTSKREIGLKALWVRVYIRNVQYAIPLQLPRGSEDGSLIDEKLEPKIGQDDICFIHRLESVDMKKTDSQEHEAPMSTRERNNLLRIIRALAVMSQLPERGYPASIQAQLVALDMTAPSDDTIRKVIEMARALKS